MITLQLCASFFRDPRKKAREAAEELGLCSAAPAM